MHKSFKTTSTSVTKLIWPASITSKRCIGFSLRSSSSSRTERTAIRIAIHHNNPRAYSTSTSTPTLHRYSTSAYLSRGPSLSKEDRHSRRSRLQNLRDYSSHLRPTTSIISEVMKQKSEEACSNGHGRKERNLNIAFLICDEPTESTLKKHGGFDESALPPLPTSFHPRY